MQEGRTSQVDVLVAGGGPSGLIAAIAAGRLGVRTLVVEHEGYFGGNATAGLVAEFLHFYLKDRQVVRGIPDQFIERLKEAGGATGFEKFVLNAASSALPLWVTGIPFNPEIAKIVADEMVIDAGSKVLFHATVTDVVMEGNRIAGVVIESVSGRREIRAKVVVDATGDAVVAKVAGVEVRGEEADFRKARMPVTLVFRLTDVDLPRFRALPKEAKQALIRKGLETGEIPWEALGAFQEPGSGDGFCLMSRISGLDTLDDEDYSQAEMTGRQQIKKMIPFLRREVPGFETCKLAGIAPRIGIRETRRIIGLYNLTDDDMYQSRHFDDTIALGGGYVDIHDDHGPGIFLKELDAPFEIPMRCMLPASVDGLVVTGRSISTDRAVNGAFRGMGPMMALGQAAGTLAAVSVKSGLSPSRVPAQDVRVILKENGAVLSEADIW